MFRVSTSRYGKLLLLVALSSGLYNFIFELVPNSAAYLVGDALSSWDAQKGKAVSIAYWMPSEWFPFLIRGFTFTYVIGAALWLFQKAAPWSGWLSTISYIGAVSCYLQSQTYVSHSFQLVGQILLILALWQQFYREQDVFPYWALELSILAVAIFYGLAGWNKVRFHGLDWFQGLNMQLFVHLFGDPESQLYQQIVSNRGVAKFGQVFTVAAELGALLAFIPKLRPLIGAALVALHLGIWLTFGWPFLANVALIVVLFFPWHTRLSEEISTPQTDNPQVQKDP